MTRAALLGLILTGCVNLTATLEVPCSAVLMRPDSLKADSTRQDTVVVFRADSLPCPRQS